MREESHKAANCPGPTRQATYMGLDRCPWKGNCQAACWGQELPSGTSEGAVESKSVRNVRLPRGTGNQETKLHRTRPDSKMMTCEASESFKTKPSKNIKNSGHPRRASLVYKTVHLRSCSLSKWPGMQKHPNMEAASSQGSWEALQKSLSTEGKARMLSERFGMDEHVPSGGPILHGRANLPPARPPTGPEKEQQKRDANGKHTGEALRTGALWSLHTHTNLNLTNAQACFSSYTLRSDPGPKHRPHG